MNHSTNSPRPALPWTLARGRAQAIFFVLGVLGVLMVAWAVEWPAPIVAVDVEQERLNVAVPVASATALVQTFTATEAGLAEVELKLAAPGVQGASGRLTAGLLGEQGNLIATRTWETASLERDQPLLLRFPPQQASAGQRYSLVLESSESAAPSVWGYDLDVYSGGTLSDSSGTAEELRFSTRYRLGSGAMIQESLRLLWQNGLLFALALAVMLLPGTFLLLLLRRRLPDWDRAAWWGSALALGLAVWPLLWYWFTLIGGHWRGWSLALFLIFGWGATLWLGRRSLASIWKRYDRMDDALRYHLLLLLLLALGLAVRLLAVRDLAFPPWVDSTRHALITQVMVEQGQMLRTYEPFLAVERFPYHAGFHTLPAALSLLGLRPLPQLLLILGQLLNALVPLSMYTATWLVTRRRRPALLAAFLVALPAFFPAYYASWGRFTQLTGVVVLPVLLALTWQLLADRNDRRLWLPVALLAAGLSFIHFRVFLIYPPFVALAWLAQRGRRSGPLVGAAGLALLLAGPRLWELQRMTAASGLLGEAQSSYRQFPTAYVAVGWEQWFLLAGAVALLVVVIATLRRRSWALLPLVLMAWSGLVYLLLSWTGDTWLINLNSAYIMFFIPLIWLLAIVADWVGEQWQRQRWPLQLTGIALAGALFAGLFLYGAHSQITVLNPVTRLARPADREGIAWVAANLPADARLAVNSWKWLGETWAGSDGGAWILPLTGRATTTPPADYIYDVTLAHQVADFNQVASAIEDWSEKSAAAWLREQGVTHVYVGARGGFLDPSALSKNPGLRLEFAKNGVFIFAIVTDG